MTKSLFRYLNNFQINFGVRKVVLVKLIEKNNYQFSEVNFLIFLRLFLTGVILCCSGCSSILSYNSVPEMHLNEVRPIGYNSNIRFWADEAPEFTYEMINERVRQYTTDNADYFKKYGTYPPLHYLALSGGGDGGAFGAGILNGWTENGERQLFSIVTGVSTGALIAPFAFLGQNYDLKIRDAYLMSSSNKIFIKNIWTVLSGLLGGPSITDNSPLKRQLDLNITQEMLNEIAIEHKRGRRLFIATTNLEAERGVIWDIGEIALSGREDSLAMVKKIMLASAAIPGIFEPVIIDVTVNGIDYQEMHVDGGVTSQLVLYPIRIQKKAVDVFRNYNLERHLYIIRNSKVEGEYKEINSGFFSITQRSIESLIKYHGTGDLYRLYISSLRDEIKYNLITIPPDFDMKSNESFDPEVMKSLYELGFKISRHSDFWQDKPPGVEYLK